MMSVTNKDHAFLAPSSSKKWLACTPSARLEEKATEGIEEEEASYTKAGTLGHELAECFINVGFLDLQADVSGLPKTKADGENAIELARSISKELHAMEVPEILKYACNYADYCLDNLRDVIFHHTHQKRISKEKIQSMLCIMSFQDVLKSFGIHYFVEKRLNLSEWVPEGFGTSDFLLIDEMQAKLTVIDLKTGDGIPVPAKNNSQLKLYALGALDLIPENPLKESGGGRKFKHTLSQVEVIVYQPSFNNISSEVLSVDELLRWGEEVVKPSAAMAFAGEGVFKVGEHCHRRRTFRDITWCRAQPICRAHSHHMMEKARGELMPPAEISDEELVALFPKLDLFAKWAQMTKKYMTDKAISGKAWDGLALVPGRAVRRWKDKEEVLDKLSKYLSKDELLDVKLKGIIGIEKKIGKEKLEEVTVKVIGRPLLTKKSTADSAKEEFK